MKVYFTEYQNIEDLRKQFKDRCLDLHPDKGGCRFKFGEMKEEYDYLIKKLSKNEEQISNKENRKPRYTYESEKNLMDQFDVLFRVPGIKIEICGYWIWISGNTFPVHERLRHLNCQWSKSKKMWYFCPLGYKKTARGRFSMKQIRLKFGSVTVDQEDNQDRMLNAA